MIVIMTVITIISIKMIKVRLIIYLLILNTMEKVLSFHQKKFGMIKSGFDDVARINVKGGDGGNGCMAMRREFRVEFGGPCGGNGGNGGSVWLECDETLNTLALLRRRVHHKGQSGKNGLGKSMHGVKGSRLHYSCSSWYNCARSGWRSCW